LLSGRTVNLNGGQVKRGHHGSHRIKVISAGHRQVINRALSHYWDLNYEKKREYGGKPLYRNKSQIRNRLRSKVRR
jgi:hypothetical protein